MSAAYDTFVDQSDFDDFAGYAFELQTNANHALRPDRIKAYLKIVMETSEKKHVMLSFTISLSYLESTFK